MDSVPRIFLNQLFFQPIESSTLSLLIVLLFISALFSAGEAAVFSLSKSQLEDLSESKGLRDKIIIGLLNKPDRERASGRLLASAHIASYLMNVLAILVWLRHFSFSPENFFYSGFIALLSIVLILVLISEVIPKTIAVRNSLTVARLAAVPLKMATVLVWPLSWLLNSISLRLEQVFKQKSHSNISMDELGHALELTADENRSEEENKILEGIVTFGDKEASQIMTSRVDVVFLHEEDSFPEVIETVVENGYSRLPVAGESPDDIKGFIVIKDLLPYLNETSFEWQKLIKPPFFIPENKRIDDLLQEFRVSKTHIAIVVDEYGGTSGIVTMEDILEEIVGDISDEFDDEELQYSKLDNRTYLMEGKTLMVDAYKILDIDETPFEEAKGDSSTLAGFLIEQAGRIPEKGDEIFFEGYKFKIEAADKRRIKRIKITLPS